MKISKKQLSLIHVAKTKLGLSDRDYRSVLVHLAGVTSSTELDREGFETVMGYFEWKGFTPASSRGKDYGERPGMASFAQLELIRVLWAEYTGHAYDGEDELVAWLSRSFKIASLRFLTKDTARKAITALKAMKARAA